MNSIPIPRRPVQVRKVGSSFPSKASISLLRSSGVVGVMTLISRVLGLIRDIVIANLFGATAGADAFCCI